jgi:redox-sensitive bicupin YhaK (pirin superfamily)
VTGRHIAAVREVQRFGADEQTDAKNLVLDPERMGESDPFLLLSEDWIPPGKGFESHPHRGFETVTLVLEGELEHRDSRGNRGVLRAGDVQWMTAGRGIVHSEMPHGEGVAHTLQLWLNLAAKDKEAGPAYQDLRLPMLDGVRVISGEYAGRRSPARNHVPVLLLEARAEVAPLVPAGWNGFVYLIDGEAEIGGTRARTGQVLTIAAAGTDAELQVRGSSLHALIAAGPPLREPIFAYGPFVMESRAGIQRAIDDYRAGKY